jgi:hypothetical protein
MNIRRLLPIALYAAIAAISIVLPIVEVSNGTWVVPDGSTELALRAR